MSSSSIHGIFHARLLRGLLFLLQEELRSLAFPALAGGFFTTAPPGKPNVLTEPLNSHAHLMTILSGRMTTNKNERKGARPTLAKNILSLNILGLLKQIFDFHSF